ncbi:MBOAT family O-acyltransferase [Sediminicoccus sp. KRV36]|uniref:MBOAT family O-acyltransferase n=1 Tax=Sediminicoccus sp. KRV36 TaxID=3133721 RepID=UPI0020103361|nr:MBOAT family O-acyltransferase [Sediminicoccus rosea]UPY36819.1 hypothetical protein LHU95_21805 [Sediminicoccus rosea]
MPQSLRLYYVLAASFFFFGYQNPSYLWLLIVVILASYGAGLAIAVDPGRRKLYMGACVALLLGLLGYFKYTDFAISLLDQGLTAAGLPGRITPLGILLPIGISFFVFQAISYVVDVYRGDKGAERNLAVLALYKAYFPQLVAGPIERSTHLLPEIRRTFASNNPASPDPAMLSAGCRLILLGFFKKLVVADNIGVFADHVFADPSGHSGLAALLGVYCFAIQIYCDFSGYTDIARGVSRLMGIELMENFRRPYFAASIREFWTRWHISLSSWFRDYLFKPLGGSRVSTQRWMFNISAVFLLSGLWHGASVNFLIWGGIHGAIYMTEQLLAGTARRLGLAGLRLSAFARRSLRVVAVLITFHIVCFAWIFFRAPGFNEAWAVVEAASAAFIPSQPLTGIGLFQRDSFAWIGLFVAVLLLIDLAAEVTGDNGKALLRRAWPRWIVYALAALAIVFFGNWNNAQQFIYFQF